MNQLDSLSGGSWYSTLWGVSMIVILEGVSIWMGGLRRMSSLVSVGIIQSIRDKKAEQG